MKLYTRSVDKSVLGNCPAAVDMSTGVIDINRSVWDRYDSFEKGFILMHEVGHYILDTDSEYEADAYALRRVYRTAPRSLKRSLQTLMKIKVIDPNRLDALYREALTLDAEDGNFDAYIELEEINQSNNPLNYKKMRAVPGQETYITKKNQNFVRAIRRADGGKCGHGMNGLHIGDWYFSLTNILLAIILIVMLTKK